jgi:hypothetical protein
LTPLPEPGLNLAKVQAVIAIPQIENAHEIQLMGGNLAQRLGLDADLLAMSEIEKTLLEQWCGTISRDCRRSSEKKFDHDPSSLLEPGS